MFITITYIRLRSWFHFFKLSNHGRKIMKQAKATPGFVRMKNTGFGADQYTLSLWESEAAMKAFSRSGAHLEAMKATFSISTEVRTLTVPGAEMPVWKEAKRMVKESGKVYRKPERKS
jgi:hypothetical protein